MVNSKKQLAILISKLKNFENPDFRLEQYPTDSEIAAEIVWSMFSRREIEGKIVADLGCGTGILGLSTLLMGAKKIFFVDIDEKVMKIVKENLKFIEQEEDIKLDDKAEFIVSDIKNFDEKVDVVIENPPFGIQGKTHADRAFLEKAFGLAKCIYTFHKAESKGFIDAITKDNGFLIEGYWEFDWPLKQTMNFHKKKIQYVKVGCWLLKNKSL